MADDAAYKQLADLLTRSATGTRFRVQVIDAIKLWLESVTPGGGGGGGSGSRTVLSKTGSDSGLTLDGTDDMLVLFSNTAAAGSDFVLCYLPQSPRLGQSVILQKTDADALSGGKSVAVIGAPGEGGNPIGSVGVGTPTNFYWEMNNTYYTLEVIWNGTYWSWIKKGVPN